MDKKIGIFSVVATPIGNLEDITFRAISSLAAADFVLAEDTRVTRKLLSHYGITNSKLERLDASVEGKKLEKILENLLDGKRIVLVSDAGTPGITDPGSRLLKYLRENQSNQFKIEAIPGPSALTAAISISGAPSDQFSFFGFPPHKKGRQKFLTEIFQNEKTSVFFESPHRILDTLAFFAEHAPDRKIFLARELTKIHEELLAGTAEELLAKFELVPEKRRGEFVVLIPAVDK